MDYARKIGKQKSDTWTKLGDCVPQRPCNQRKPTTAVLEDRRLANWKRWLADRERRQKYLAAALKREPIDLALNAHERVRARNETKCLLEAAGRTELTNQDKYRGNPTFWTPEERLKNGTEDEEDDDDLIVKKSKSDRFLPPDNDRVALSGYIKKEKMLIEAHADPAKIDLNSKWNCSEYLKQRTMQLKREIKFLEPKQPEMENLIVIGKNFVCSEKEDLIRIPVITITQAKTKRKLLDDPDDRAALKIQDREFVLENARHFEKLSREKTQELQEAKEDLNEKTHVYAPFDCSHIYEIVPQKYKPVTWTLHFRTKDNEICERTFHIENRGVRVVHVEWRESKPDLVPITLPKRISSHFFFNKGRISILPGQKVEVPIWFRADRPIVSTETWRLIVNPKVYPGTLHLRLWAMSVGEEYKLKQKRQSDDVRAFLTDQVQNSIIRDVIQELLMIATTNIYKDEVPYEMYFLESELFRARNRGYYYKSIFVNELKQMYKNANCDKDWDLSLSSLRSILLKLEDSTVRREQLLRFQTICQECLLPDIYYTPPKASKEKLVYWLLCMFVNRFEDEDEFVMRCCCRELNADDMGEEEGGIPEIEDGESEVFITSKNLQIYREAMFIRIYSLLLETIDKICMAVESCDFFYK